MIKGGLRALVKYDNFKDFFITFYASGILKENYLKLKFLTVNSPYFSAYIKGDIRNNDLNAKYKVFINPLKKESFYLDLIKIEGEAYGKFPKININGKGHIPKIAVNKRSYEEIFINIQGYADIFSDITLNFEGKGKENLHFSGTYNVVPEGIIKFKFENLPVDSYTLKIPLQLESLFKGNGIIDLSNKKISLFAESSKFQLENMRFNLYLNLNYRIKNQGVLLFLGENKGKFMGFLEFGKNLKGYLKLVNLEYQKSGLNFYAFGDIIFKKEKVFSSNLDIRIKNIRYSDINLPNLKIYGNIYGKNLNINLKSKETYGKITGNFENLNGFFHIKNYKILGNEKKITLKNGLISLSLNKSTISAEGNNISSEIFLKQVKVFAKTSFKFLKYGKNFNLNGSGISDIYFSDKNVLKEFKYRYSLKKQVFRFSGFSKETKFKLVYNLKRKIGKLEGKYLKEKLRIITAGSLKNEDLILKISALYDFLGEKIKLKANVKRKNGVISFKLLPYTYRGNKIDIELKGIEGRIINENLSISFKGLYVHLLNRNLISLYPSKAEGKLRNFLLSLKISGVYNGALNAGFLNRPFLVSSGFLDLELLSSYVGSLMRSKLKGELICAFVFENGKFSFVASTEKPIKVVSRFFFQPFESSIYTEVDNNGIRFSQTAWFKEGYLNLYAFSKDFRNFEIKGNFKNIPVGYRDDIKLRLKADGRINVIVNEFRKFKIDLKSEFDGYARIKKRIEKRKEEKKFPFDIFINAEFKTKNNFVVYLPEGRIYTNIDGKVYGKLPTAFYNVNIVLRAGILNYFGKTFYLRSGIITAIRNEEREITRFKLDLHTVEDDYKIFLSIRGTPENPEVFYFSEPPLSRREILLRLIGGGVQESVLPIGTVLQRELRAIGKVERLLDIKLDFGLITSSTGEVGAVLRLKKDIGRFLSVYYQASSSEDKRDTYLGGEVRFPTDMELGFRFYLYSDNTREYKLRYIKEFDF